MQSVQGALTEARMTGLAEGMGHGEWGRGSGRNGERVCVDGSGRGVSVRVRKGGDGGC